MVQQAVWVTDEQVERTVEAVSVDAFTIVDFVRAFGELYPAEWDALVAAFGLRGDGTRRSYTAATYLGNRLSQLSRKPGSPLLPLLKWQAGGVETPSQRRATPEERALTGGNLVRVFRKRA